MLGRYLQSQGLGATNVEWGERIRTGGFTVAGIAITIAAAAFILPMLAKRFVMKKATRSVAKRIKRA